MCGITVCIKEKREDVSFVLSNASKLQRHRGPDDEGYFFSYVGKYSLGLAHQRLSILDLTDAGHQPMESFCGRYVLSYNGEVYNYQEIAKELGDDPVLKISNSDTSVVLAALIRWGTEAFKRFNGMWALAFFDRLEGKLLLSRDRLGVKPLFFHQDGNNLHASSEIKGILGSCPGKKFRINYDAVARFLKQSLTGAELDTFFSGIEAFPPACYAEIDLNDESLKVVPTRYWFHPYERADGIDKEAPSSRDIKELFLDSVRLRMRADVPVGIMLSGGLDSSSILSAAKYCNPDSQLLALSAISDDPATSEEIFIDKMIDHVDCRSLKINVDDDPVKLLNDMSLATWHFEYPIRSFSTLVHRNNIRKARENGLVVLLTGQGADEQLGGYNKFLYFYLKDRVRRWRFAGPVSMILGCLREGTILNEFKIQNAKRYIPFLRDKLSDGWIGKNLKNARLSDTSLGSSYEEREWKDLKCFSLPSLLLSEDRLSMSHSTEMRTPFLDYRLVEALARVKPEKKLVKGWTKHIFRNAIDDILPSEVTWRKDKKGYSVPGEEWIRGSLRSDFEAVINQSMISDRLGLINGKGAQELFREFCNGSKSVRYQDVFSIFSLEVWLKVFSDYIDLEDQND